MFKVVCKLFSKPPTYREISNKVVGLNVKGVRSTGPGGQCVNRRASAAEIVDEETGIRVKATSSRYFHTNQHYAKKRLIEKLDVHYNGAESKKMKKAEKARKTKARRVKRSKEKYVNLNKKKDN